MKKIIFIITFLSFVVSYAQEKTVIESTEEEVEIIEVIADDDVEVVDPYRSTNSVDIVTGEIENTLLIFKGKNTNLYGLKDKKGKMLVKPVFYSIVSYNSSKDRIIAATAYNKNGVIDPKGKVIIPFEYSSIYKTKNTFKAKKDDQTYIFDYYGKPLLKKAYDEIYFENDLIKVKENGLYGFLDLEGKEILPIKYEELSYYENKSWYVVKQNGVANFLNKEGENIFGEKYTSLAKINFDFNYLLAEKNEKFGVINASDKEVIPIIFDEIKPDYLNSLFIVKKNGKWGVYDAFFKQFLIEPNNTDIKNLSKNLYLLSDVNKKTIYNVLLHKKVNVTNYEKIKSHISNGLIIVENNNLNGIFNMNIEKLIVPLNYNYIYYTNYYLKCNISNSIASDYYDFKGNLLLKNVSFSKRLKNNYNHQIITSNGKLGVLYKDKVIIETKYDHIKDFKNSNFVLVKSDNKKGLISLVNGKFLIPLSTENIIVNDQNTVFWKKKKYNMTLNKLVEIN